MTGIPADAPVMELQDRKKREFEQGFAEQAASLPTFFVFAGCCWGSI
ncbi:MAG: hypothetical protein WCS40_00050 [Methanomethylophilus sp.]